MDPQDDQAIRHVVQDWQAAWNAGDMRSAAELFCEDADFVNVGGTHWHGRERIQSEHVRLHQQQLTGSVFEPLQVGVQSLGPGTALVHIQRLLSGDHDPDETPRKPRRGVLSWLLLRDATGEWRIRSAQNTNTVTAT